MNLSDSIKLFLQEQKARGNTMKTIKDYEQNLSYFLDFYGDNPADEIDKTLVLDYIVYLREKPKNLGHQYKKVDKNIRMSSVTVQSYVRHLKAFLVWLYENEYIEVDIAHKFKLPKAKKELKKVLSDEEIKSIFRSCDHTNDSLRNKLIISFMLYSGLRANEVVLLKKVDFDVKNHLYTVFGKGQKERIVPIGNITYNYLVEYLARENKYKHYRNQDFLFLDTYGKPISYNAIRLMISRLAKRSKVTRLHAHLLRHTFATRYLIKTKGDITSLKAILGHTSLKVVENYLHLAMSYSIGQYKEFCD